MIIIVDSTSSSPSFAVSTCTRFYCNFFTPINPTKSVKIPEWTPSLGQASISYDLSPPSYQQITEVIQRIKVAGSLCPLDKISIIPFKRCPYLRSLILLNFSVSYGSLAGFRTCGKRHALSSYTEKVIQQNRVTLGQSHLNAPPHPLKIFTSCLRDSLFAFLIANGFIEHKLQKGFLPKLSGTFEQIAQMANIADTDRIKQRSVVITLLDLKSAFSEVHHNLISEILSYHQVPDHIQQVIRSLYSNFQTSIVTDSFQTPFITVRRGVLHEDYLSPLTFNSCFYTFIHNSITKHAEKHFQLFIKFWNNTLATRKTPC